MKILIKIVLLTSISCASWASIISGPSFSLNADSAKVSVGDSFDIDVLVHDAFANAGSDELLLGFGFNSLLTGSGGLQFLGRTVNPLFSDISAQDGVNLDAAGWVFLGLAGGDIGSSFTLATLHFQALSAGNVSVSVVSDLADFNQGLTFPHQDPLPINANVNLEITAVPLPSAVWLFASSLLLGIGAQRRQARQYLSL